MKRTLSIVVDDDAKTIGTNGATQFTIMELLGIGEYIRIQAEHDIMRDIAETDAKSKEEEG